MCKFLLIGLLSTTAIFASDKTLEALCEAAERLQQQAPQREIERPNSKNYMKKTTQIKATIVHLNKKGDEEEMVDIMN
jgi:hypothetical protein